MKNTSVSSAIMVGALAMSLATSAALAAPPPTDPRASRSAPVTLDELLTLYLSSNPALRGDAAFARDWTVTTKCAAWSPLSNDEFKGAPFLKAGAAELAAGRGEPASTYVMRFDRYLERYDPAVGEFGLRTVTGNDVLPVRIPGFYGGSSLEDRFELGCTPTSGRFPVEFDIKFDNSAVANGLPMAPDAAATFAASRTNQNGSRNNGVVVELKVALTLGSPKPLGAVAVKGVVVPVTAHILNVVVEDGTPQRRQLYALTDAKRQAGDAEGVAAAQQARNEASVKPITAASLRTQFEMERAGSKVGSESFRANVQTLWQKVNSGAAREFSFPMQPVDVYNLGGLSLRFDNAEEVAALKPAPDLAARLEKGSLSDASVVFVAVGAFDDPLKGGQGVVGHVLSIESVDQSTGTRRIFVTRTTSTPKPWEAPKRDERLAGDFDVAGLKTGMTPDEVVRVAASELSQKLSFNEGKAEIRSTETDCDFDFRRDRVPPPFGRRCLVATFAKLSGGSGWAMTKFRLDQSVPTDQAAKINTALNDKYGKADFATRYEGKLSLSDLEGTDPPRMVAVGWGARLTDRRPERDGVPFPLHPLEMTTKVVGNVTVMSFAVTDWAAINAQAEAATAASKRASDAMTPKF